MNIPKAARASWTARVAVRQGSWSIVSRSTSGPDALTAELERRLEAGGLALAEKAERRIREERLTPAGALVCALEEPPLVVCTSSRGSVVLVTAWLVSVWPPAAPLPRACCTQDEFVSAFAAL